MGYRIDIHDGANCECLNSDADTVFYGTKLFGCVAKPNLLSSAKYLNKLKMEYPSYEYQNYGSTGTPYLQMTPEVFNKFIKLYANDLKDNGSTQNLLEDEEIIN